jgi:hypothetical protein
MRISCSRMVKMLPVANNIGPRLTYTMLTLIKSIGKPDGFVLWARIEIRLKRIDLANEFL